MALRTRLHVTTTALVVCLASSGATAQALRQVRITSTPPGATVRADDAASPPLGVTPLRTRIRGGAHRLFFDLAGYVQAPLDVNVTRANQVITTSLTQAGAVYVAADVEGAAILMDGTQVGTTSGRINNVPPGQHIIEVRNEGREPARETVTVSPGGLSTVNITLRPRVAPTGTVRVVVSNPAGPVPADLQVTLDGAPITGNPPSSDQVQPGTHIVQVSATGFRSTRREVTVTAGQAQAIAIDLETAAAATGTVNIIVPAVDGVQVFLDGEAVEGTGTRRTRPNVGPGSHSVRITAPGRVTVTRDVAVIAGQQANVEVAELAQAAQQGRIAVRTNAPGATVILDGAPVGAAPYERTDAPYGQHVVIVRAPDHAESQQTCNIDPSHACELVFNLQETARLRVAANVPTARVRVGNEPAPRPVGDLTELPVGATQLVVGADGYQDTTVPVELHRGENAPVMVTLRRARTAEMDSRRAAMSTFGASPLSRGDFALDAFTNLFGMPLEVRATLGFMPYARLGVDGGLTIRTRFDWVEFELRSRVAYRFANDLFVIGAEGRVYGGLGSSKRGGAGLLGQLNVTVQRPVIRDDEDAENMDIRERTNRFGSFAFTLHLGFEFNGEGMGTSNPTVTSSVRDQLLGTSDNGDRTLCENPDLTGANPTRGNHPAGSDCTTASTLRGFLGGTIEFGLSRHWSVMAGMTYYLSNPDEAPLTGTNVGSNVGRRVLTTSFWNYVTPVNPRLGVTFRF